MPAVDDFAQERRRNRIDEVRPEHARSLKVDLVGVARFLVVVRRISVVEVHPEFGRIDAGVLDLGERQLVGVDVVDREEAGNTFAPCRGRDKPGHPVVAVDKIGLNSRNDVVDDFALERERKFQVVIAL